MTMQHLPRPWMLAALTDVPVARLAQQNAMDTAAEEQEDTPPRPEPRRRRLSAPRRAWADQWRGGECRGGTTHWHQVEVDRAA